ncbi:SCPU domain-containing protein [Limnobaculum zhutongyuii]|uniref:SCPU domain-containing protein n=1 Tax=Limnobaculum zhutongyuii TaxID=2498113 RepID=A0A411WI42_9GAMM|nr:spore coat U domain-containing protein [Limnobaculum zhutongyuii]QBH95697.1 SCPU domain-containing protein [Limnobaculum zhutongyuii]TQS86538.1 SCPU domain-containing protein [Limnobaculum zhutongyuii]
MKKVFLALTCITSLVSSATVFAAGNGQVSGTLGVQLTITNGCAINGNSVQGSPTGLGTLDFGSHSTLANNITAQSASSSSGTIKVQCTNTLPYTVTLDSGEHPTGTQRRLAQGTEFINYNLYQDSLRAVLWEDTTLLSRTSTGAPDDLTVYGLVPPQNTPSAGIYSDTVLVTVDW